MPNKLKILTEAEADSVWEILEENEEFGFLVDFLERAADIGIIDLINANYHAAFENEEGVWLFTKEEYREIVRKTRKR